MNENKRLARGSAVFWGSFCIGTAIYMALNGIPNWGWFLGVGFLLTLSIG